MVDRKSLFDMDWLFYDTKNILSEKWYIYTAIA